MRGCAVAMLEHAGDSQSEAPWLEAESASIIRTVGKAFARKAPTALIRNLLSQIVAQVPASNELGTDAPNALTNRALAVAHLLPTLLRWVPASTGARCIPDSLLALETTCTLDFRLIVAPLSPIIRAISGYFPLDLEYPGVAVSGDTMSCNALMAFV